MFRQRHHCFDMTQLLDEKFEAYQRGFSAGEEHSKMSPETREEIRGIYSKAWNLVVSCSVGFCAMMIGLVSFWYVENKELTNNFVGSMDNLSVAIVELNIEQEKKEGEINNLTSTVEQLGETIDRLTTLEFVVEVE